MAEQIRFAAQLADVGAPFIEFGGRGPPGPVGRRELAQVDPRVSVERRPLLARPGQAQLVGLTVNGEQVLGEVAQDCDRGGRAADMGARTTGSADGPAQDEPGTSVATVAALVVEFAAGVAHALARSRLCVEYEPAVDGGLVAARPHPGSVGPSAEQQQQPGHDHRLAGAGLARDHGQAGTERQRGVVDDTESADAQFLEHQSPSSITVRASRSLPAASPRAGCAPAVGTW